MSGFGIGVDRIEEGQGCRGEKRRLVLYSDTKQRARRHRCVFSSMRTPCGNRVVAAALGESISTVEFSESFGGGSGFQSSC